uniref:Uncharacterized protein n=1 Tax=Anguilla anguilla TaxID=7936 RepID=A0A0E9RMV9_ANGAN
MTNETSLSTSLILNVATPSHEPRGGFNPRSYRGSLLALKGTNKGQLWFPTLRAPQMHKSLVLLLNHFSHKTAQPVEPKGGGA